MKDQKIALITGASRGLGAAFAVALAADHHVVAVARTVGGLEEIDDRVRGAGGSVTLAPMDVTNAEAMAQLCRSIFERWGHVDIWVHTAIHAAPLAPAAHIDAKDWDNSVATNITATARLIPMVEPLLQAAENGVAMIPDDPCAGKKFFGSYGATKAAQIALARSWQSETRKTGPRVFIPQPTPMPTAVRARFFPGEDRGGLADPMNEARRILTEIFL